jgi:hypothetical protein
VRSTRKLIETARTALLRAKEALDEAVYDNEGTDAQMAAVKAALPLIVEARALLAPAAVDGEVAR